MSFLAAAAVFFAGTLLALAFLATGNKDCFKTCLSLGMAAAMLVLAVCAAVAYSLEYRETHQTSDMFAGYMFSGIFFVVCLVFALIALGKEALFAIRIATFFAVWYLIMSVGTVAVFRRFKKIITKTKLV